MAVTMKPKNLLHQLGVASADIAWLADHGIQVTVGLKAIEFTWIVKGLELAAVPCQLADVQKLLKGQLLGPPHAELSGKVQAVIAKLKEEQMTTTGALALLKKAGLQPASEAPPVEASATVVTTTTFQTAWPIFDPDKMKTAQPIKLRDAEMMYQPVRGSSAHSRYFLVAANQHVRVAARYKGPSLSVRIEGPAWEQYQDKIKACGFDNVSIEKGYASLHLAVPTDVLAAKALGAVLLGLGVPMETPLPDLNVIKDIGT